MVFKITGINAIWYNSVQIDLTIKDKEIKIVGEGSGENGIIDAAMKGLSKHLGKDTYTIETYDSTERASIGKIAKDYNIHVIGVTNKDIEKGSEQIGIVTFGLKNIETQDTLNTKSASKNVEKATIKALIYGHIKELYESV